MIDVKLSTTDPVSIDFTKKTSISVSQKSTGGISVESNGTYIKGDTGPPGEKGDKGDKGDSYIITDADYDEIATKTADLTNTRYHEVVETLTKKADIASIPSKVSQLDNDLNYASDIESISNSELWSILK